jgi:hypothetical protein
MKKVFPIKLILLILVFSGCKKDVDKIQPGSFQNNIANKINKNIPTVSNGDFDKQIEFDNPKKNFGWTKQAYITNSAIFSWGKKIGRNKGGISLEAGGGISNDIAITQQITLDPNKFYRLHAWIKTENVSGGTGANICLYGTWAKSESVSGTTEWQKVSLDLPPNSNEVTIACRLGFWAGTSTGKAYFDDVSLEEVNKFVEVGQHVRLILDQEDASAVSTQTITSWISNLDNAYAKYYGLMGSYPYNGAVITILSTNTYPGGWAVAGNPILWYKPYIKSELQTIESSGTWSFGIMHELAHDFVLENSNKNWIINEEMFANFRMYYVVEKLNATIVQGKVYHGTELENYYKTDANESYVNGIAKGIPLGYDGLMYTLIRIKNQIGWEPIIKAIKDLNTSTISPGTRWQMFNLLLDKLTIYSNQDVRNTYPAGELDVIQQLTSN